MKNRTGTRYNFGRVVRLGLGVLAGIALYPRAALADCEAPAPAIVWSYPAQGDTGVPTNVDLWLLPSGWGGPARVSLDGVELDPLDMSFGYELGELAPNTSYTLLVEPEYYGEEGAPLELTFTTGAGPAAPDEAAAPGAVSATRTADAELSGVCRAVLATQDCFDTGQDTYFTFTPSGTSQGWLMTSDAGFRRVYVWPAECGAPRLLLHGTTQPCVTLHGIDASGALHAGELVCAPAAAGSEPDDNGPATESEPPTAIPGSGVAMAGAGSSTDEGSPTTLRGSSTTPLQSSRNESGCSLGASRGAAATGWLWWSCLGLAWLGRRRLTRT